MSTKPRTPEHFPRMKHRAAKRRVLYVDILPNLDAFQTAVTAASGGFSAMADRLAAITEAVRQIFGIPGKQSDYTLSPPPLEPTQPTTEAAPNRAASFMPGDIVTVNNPGSSLHGRVGRVRHRPTPHVARVDFGDMNSYLVRHEHLTKGERE